MDAKLFREKIKNKINKTDFPLRELRKEMLLTQKEAAAIIGVDRSHFSRAENMKELDFFRIYGYYIPLLLFKNSIILEKSILENKE